MTKKPSAPARLDPADPWMIDTRELGRRPGSLRRYQRRIPAPPGFGLEVVGVPPAGDIVLDLRLESVMEGVLATGTVLAPTASDCSRCLDAVVDEVEVEFTELFAYPDTGTDDTTDPDEVSRVVEDLIDLEPTARDAVLLALPNAPLCAEDCRGLCPDCGEKWADLPANHHHETMDARWAALREMYGSGSGTVSISEEI